MGPDIAAQRFDDAGAAVRRLAAAGPIVELPRAIDSFRPDFGRDGAGALIGEARSFLCGQLWKYPSERTISLLRYVLDSAAAIPHREHVERARAFLDRLAHPRA